MSKTTTAVIELENVDLNEAASDFTDIGRLVTDITAIITGFSDGLPSSIQRADAYIVRISALLERSAAATYRSPVGSLYGSAADRYALMAQSIVKLAATGVGRNEAEIKRLVSGVPPTKRGKRTLSRNQCIISQFHNKSPFYQQCPT